MKSSMLNIVKHCTMESVRFCIGEVFEEMKVAHLVQSQSVMYGLERSILISTGKGKTVNTVQQHENVRSVIDKAFNDAHPHHTDEK